MQARLVKPLRTEDRVVDEALGSGENREEPKGQAPPPRDFTQPLDVLPTKLGVIQMQLCLVI